MTKTEMIECFNNDKDHRELKDQIEKIVNRLSKICNKEVQAGVEESSFYVIDSEYHIFCEKKNIKIKKMFQCFELPIYYIVSCGHEKHYCYNFKQIETAVKLILEKYIK